MAKWERGKEKVGHVSAFNRGFRTRRTQWRMKWFSLAEKRKKRALENALSKYGVAYLFGLLGWVDFDL